MKKTALSAMLAVAFGVAALAPQPATASDGKLIFKGEITTATCTVTGGGAASGAGNITVTLPSVSESALHAAGSVAGEAPFQLILGGGTECTSGKTASLWIESAQTLALDSTTGALKNLDGTAAVVQVQMVNPANNQPIHLGINETFANGATVVSGSNQPAATINSGHTATLSYVAQYLHPLTSTAGAVTAGTVDTFLTYSMQYN